MSIVQRIVLLIKVMVLMSLGMSAAWAQTPVHSQAGVSSVQSQQGKGLLVAEENDDKEDDDSTSKEPDSDDSDDDDGDSQS